MSNSYKDLDLDNLTPMMQQYMGIKKRFPDALIMYRLGDFYESFFSDAEIISKELELALTKRNAGNNIKAPMCGVPHYVVDGYITKLVEKGHKVAIVEQLEDPKEAKGIVKRDITRIITPGTLLDVESLNQKENNYLLSIIVHNHGYGIAYLDVSTGELKATEFSHTKEREVISLINNIGPSEVIINKIIEGSLVEKYIETHNIFYSLMELKSLDLKEYSNSVVKHLGEKSLLKVENKNLCIMAISNLLEYVYTFEDHNLSHINNLEYINVENYLKIDANSKENLELIQNLSDRTRKNSLLGVLDRASTSMGSRKIKRWLEMPLTDVDQINYRLDFVQIFYEDLSLRLDTEEILKTVYDIERLMSKIAYNKANARDLLSLKVSTEEIPNLKVVLRNSNKDNLIAFEKKIDDLRDIYSLIDKAIVDEPPILITEGGLIKEGYSEELDKLKYMSTQGNKKLLEYEQKLIKETDIPKLRITYNKNTGHLIEVTNSYKEKVPEYFVRKQTLKGKERYSTKELDEIANMILHSKDEAIDFEYKIFQNIRKTIEKNVIRIQATADLIAELDVYCSLGKVAYENNYTRPTFNSERKINIINGRHPVVEQNTKESFIGNDTHMGGEYKKIQIITGPNMAGKSTYMRQNAIILIMAQMGSFVPCDKSNLPINDQIFTRIGASDNLSKGESTFMVEMKEMSYILNNATEDSFVVLDEVGRGTSTNDGLSIAFAIVEYLNNNLLMNTLFATHYHELTILEDRLSNVINLKVNIEEYEGKLVFLRKIERGRADKSYGVEVAKLSGLPDQVINRANYFLDNLDKLESDEIYSQEEKESYNKFEVELFMDKIKNIDINSMSPIEGLNTLNKIIKEAGELDGD